MNGTFGARMKAKREEKQLTLQQIATQIGVARSTVQRYEADTITCPKMPVVHGIARCLGTSSEYLLGKTDDDAPREVQFDDFTYALYNESKALTPENKQKLLEMARFFAQHQ